MGYKLTTPLDLVQDLLREINGERFGSGGITDHQMHAATERCGSAHSQRRSEKRVMQCSPDGGRSRDDAFPSLAAHPL